MKTKLIKSLIDHSPLGYAYHKIVCDGDGKPCDYEFVEVNKAFEALTGLSAKKIIGKRITEVLPGIENGAFDWIGQCGDVALNGKVLEFEQMSELLGKHYRVKAFSPEHGFFITMFSDTTQEHILKEDKQKMEVDFQSLFQNINSGTVVLRVIGSGEKLADYVIEDVNKVCLNYIEEPRREVIGKDLESFSYALLCQDDLLDMYREALQTGAPRRMRKRQAVGGHLLWLDYDVFRLSNKSIVVMFNDDTDVMLAHEHTKAARNTLQKYIENAPNAVFVVDEDLCLLEVNKQVQEMTGYPAEELIGESYLKLSDDKARDDEAFANLKRDGRLDVDLGVIRKDGRRRTWNIRATKLSEERYLGFATDITQRFELEAMIRNTQREYRALLDNAPVIISYFNVDGTLKWLNTEAAARHAGKVEELIGQPLTEYYEAQYADEYFKRFKKALETEENAAYIDHVQKSDDSIWYQTTYGIVLDEQGEKLGVQVASQDITELVEGERRYHTIFDKAALGIVNVTPEGSIVNANAKYCEILGYSLDELKKLNIADVSHPDDYAKSLEMFGRLRRGELENLEFEKRYVRKDGEVVHVILSSALHYDNCGHLEYTITTVQDITARKRAEMAVRESEEMFRAVFDHSPIGIGLLDLDENRLYRINARFSGILGMDEKDILNTDPQEFYRGDAQSRFDNMVKQLYNGETMSFEAKIPDYANAENNKWISVTLVLMPSAQRKANVLCIVEDISDSKRNTQVLENSEAKLRALISNNTDVITVHDENGVITFVGGNVKHWFGWAPEDIIGKEPWFLIHPNDRDRAQTNLINLVKKANATTTNEYIYQHKDGSTRPVEVRSINLLHDEHIRGVLINTRDISQSRELQQANVRMEAHLRNQQKLESIGTLAGGVAHEINNPINGIMNYSQLILDSGVSSDVTDYAGEIIHETKRVSAIVKDLLQFSRHTKQNHSKARVEDIVGQTLSLIKTIIKHDQIDLRVDIAKNLPVLQCRSQQIQQVLMNLLTNARDALNEKYEGYDDDKLLMLSCKRAQRDGKDGVCITVEDHGGGISKDVQKQIFDPFFTTKGRETGTGLGLAISYGIVKEHGGDLTFEMEAGKYTRFFVYLPCK